jgi:hypothetical protein
MYEFVEYYRRERNHQGLDNELIDVPRLPGAMVGFAVVSVSAGCSTTIAARRDGSVNRLGPSSGTLPARRAGSAASTHWWRSQLRLSDGIVPKTTSGRPSYLHGHSGISRASSRHSGGKGRGRLRAALISDTVLPVYSGGRAIRLSRPVASETHGPAGSGGRLSVIMPPRRWMGTSRRPPIGWLQRGPGGRRPHVPSGLLEPSPLCRSTSRQASARETPSGEAPGCVPGRRTRLIAGRW